jgi:hypothetical protein
MSTEEKIKISPSSGLYKSLLKELNSPKEQQNMVHEENEDPEMALAEEETTTYSRKR